jgi:hypothetical protein
MKHNLFFSHVIQLKNLLEKSNKSNQEDESQNETISKKKKKYKERPFDFGNYNKRHVFLKFAYLGW